jgi:hypothetical protein
LDFFCSVRDARASGVAQEEGFAAAQGMQPLAFGELRLRFNWKIKE